MLYPSESILWFLEESFSFEALQGIICQRRAVTRVGDGCPPDKPGAAVGERAVLSPRTEMVPTANALPAGADDGEVVLPDEHVLLLAS